MNCEVAVVGGGIGGLTVAAVLSQRGVDVCLLERESQLGGCVAPVEKFGYTFDPTDGLYTGWSEGGIHSQIFSELPIEPPETRRLQPAYVVALPDGEAVSVSGNLDELESEFSRVFPECCDAAVSFYRRLAEVGPALAGNISGDRTFFDKYSADTTDKHLGEVSTRFRRFIDVQLQTFAQGNASQVSYLYAASTLVNQRGMFAIAGGAAALAERLAESIRKSGGKVRLNSPVLRLSYDSAGKPTGVDLLTGETVTASRAIVSNLTIWDTYGKLVGLNKTPAPVRKQFNDLRGWGAYIVFAGIDDHVADRLPHTVLQLLDWQDGQDYDPESGQLTFSVANAWDRRGPEDKRAVTIHSITDVDGWFTFHRDDTELEETDQEKLEQVWDRLHKAMPELGSSIEVIETATPRSYYEQTRRKLGMAGGLTVTPAVFTNGPFFETALPNLFIVSDTSAYGGIAGVSQHALSLANHLSK